MLMAQDNIDKLDFLYKEIEYAKSQLQPQDTGHISTAIGWLETRLRETQEEIRAKSFKNPVGRFK
jgi:hypothetical protein